MILFFSGTGNSEYVAGRIGSGIKEEPVNLFEKIKNHDFSEVHSDRPWVVVTPTYAWRIPRILEEWLERTSLSGSREIYFVMTCGEGIGNSEKYLKKLCSRKGMEYKGCLPVVMPENYIAIFTTPDKEDALNTIRQAEGGIERITDLIARGSVFLQPSISVKDRVKSGIVNDLFYPMFVHAKKFYVTDTCISCKKCESVCPLSNVHLANGKPVWGTECTHCMACICRCPVEAIEYGDHSKGLPRYVCNPKDLYKTDDR